MRFAKGMSCIEPSDIREILKLTANPGIISFAGGVPDADLFPIEALAKAAEHVFQKDAKTALQYGTTEGHAGLRQKIAQRMKARGMDTDPDELLITTGAQQAISMVGQVFLDPGDKALCESPTYSGTINAFLVYQPEFVEVNSNDHGMDIASLQKALQENPDVKLIYVAPNYQNPSGRVWSLETRKAFMEAIQDYDLAVFEDDPYGELYFEGDAALPTLKSMDQQGKIIYSGSFSKVLCPGLRVGWVCAKPEILRNFVVLKQTQDIHTSQLAQNLIDQYLEENDLDAQIDKIRAVYGRRRTVMLQAMDQYMPDFCTYTRPQGGMFVWLTLPQRYNTRELLKKAIDAGVAFIPGGGFFAKKGNENCMRLCYATMDEEKIVEGIRRLGDMIKKF